MNKSIILAAVIIAVGIVGGVWLYNYNSPVNACIRAKVTECELRSDCEPSGGMEAYISRVTPWCVKQAGGG